MEFAARRGIPPLRLPEGLIHKAFRVFLFPDIFRLFPACNLSGCSSTPRHDFPLLKIYFRKFPHFSAYFRFQNVQFSMLKCFRWMDTGVVL